jgi:hypothetical protein
MGLLAGRRGEGSENDILGGKSRLFSDPSPLLTMTLRGHIETHRPSRFVSKNNSEQIDWLITSTANPLPLIAKTRVTIIPQT